MDIESLVNANGLSCLAFLRVAMQPIRDSKKRPRGEVRAELHGREPLVQVDDISISYIYRIAELYGLDVKVNLHPKSASQI